MGLVTIASYREPYEAHIFCSLLESNEIPAFVIHEHHVGLNWLYSDAIGGVKLQVAAEHREFALELLASDSAQFPDLPKEPAPIPEDESSCPKCRSVDTFHTSLDRRTKAMSLLVGFPFVWGRDRWRCTNCGHQWRRRFPFRNPVHVLAELIVLIAQGILWVILIPIRIFQDLIGAKDLLSKRKFACWNCGSNVLPAKGECSECGIPLPDESSFLNIIVTGKHYDAQCESCHTPYAFEDYSSSNSDWRCSRCRSLLSNS
jgi:hypothetical protein